MYYLSCRDQQFHLSSFCVQLIFVFGQVNLHNTWLVNSSFFSNNYDMMIDLIKCHERLKHFFSCNGTDQTLSIKKKEIWNFSEGWKPISNLYSSLVTEINVLKLLVSVISLEHTSRLSRIFFFWVIRYVLNLNNLF